jgi:ketosteroid isomerase-like protein
VPQFNAQRAGGGYLPRMAHETPIAVVRSILAGWSRGDMWAGGGRYAENVVFTSDWPDGSATCRGLDEMTRFMRDFLGQWDMWRVEGHRFAELVSGTVLVEGRSYAAGTRSGIEVDNAWFGIFVFRDDKIAKLHVHHDRQEVLAVAGLAETASAPD